MITPQTAHNYEEHAALDDIYIPCRECGVSLVPDDMPEYSPDGTVLCPDCAWDRFMNGDPSEENAE